MYPAASLELKKRPDDVFSCLWPTMLNMNWRGPISKREL